MPTHTHTYKIVLPKAFCLNRSLNAKTLSSYSAVFSLLGAFAFEVVTNDHVENGKLGPS